MGDGHATSISVAASKELPFPSVLVSLMEQIYFNSHL